MSAEVTTTAKRRFWPAEWARSEAFWRDVASRAAAGTIVIALGAAAAVAAGIIDWKEFGRGAMYVGATSIAIGLTIQLSIGLIRPVYRFFEKIKNTVARVLLQGVATLLLGVPLLCGLVVVRVAFPLIAAL